MNRRFIYHVKFSLEGTWRISFGIYAEKWLEGTTQVLRKVCHCWFIEWLDDE